MSEEINFPEFVKNLTKVILLLFVESPSRKQIDVN